MLITANSFCESNLIYLSRCYCSLRIEWFSWRVSRGSQPTRKKASSIGRARNALEGLQAIHGQRPARRLVGHLESHVSSISPRKCPWPPLVFEFPCSPSISNQLMQFRRSIKPFRESCARGSCSGSASACGPWSASSPN